MTPAWEITLGGAAIGGDLNDRLLALTCTLHDGHETDSLDIVVDDRGFAVVAPDTGAVLGLSLGYRETGLVFMGIYTVDNVDVTGFPSRMTIRAKSADQKSAQKQSRTKKYEKKKLGAIVNEVAGRHGLKNFISSDLASIEYPYLHQTEESDWHFLTRLSHNHDALFSIKNGMLVFVKRGDSLSASGLSMPQLVLKSTDLLGYRADSKDRPNYKQVHAVFHSRKHGRAQIVNSNLNAKGKAHHTLRHQHQNEALAKAAADAKSAQLQRAGASCTVEIKGDPTVQPEGTMLIQSGRTVLDGEWLIKNVTHAIAASGYRTHISGETKSGKR